MIREKIQEKIHELEWKNNLKSLEMINWLNELLDLIPVEEVKKEEVKKEVKVELPEEKKPAPKKKIVFKKK